VPYLKQFYVGGAQSNRGWQIRELGPGGYKDTNAINPNLPFYQTGDIKIDLSVEWEFPLFWVFNGALFVDAANVWTLYYDEERHGSRFDWDYKRGARADGIPFFQEFGVGYGYGFRADFDYFEIRFDFGYKLFNPYPVEYEPDKKSRFLYNEVKKFPGGAEPQIAIGSKF
jgi:outer membrane protein assembly factor BamA